MCCADANHNDSAWAEGPWSARPAAASWVWYDLPLCLTNVLLFGVQFLCVVLSYWQVQRYEYDTMRPLLDQNPFIWRGVPLFGVVVSECAVTACTNMVYKVLCMFGWCENILQQTDFVIKSGYITTQPMAQPMACLVNSPSYGAGASGCCMLLRYISYFGFLGKSKCSKVPRALLHAEQNAFDYHVYRALLHAEWNACDYHVCIAVLFWFCKLFWMIQLLVCRLQTYTGHKATDTRLWLEWLTNRCQSQCWSCKLCQNFTLRF